MLFVFRVLFLFLSLVIFLSGAFFVSSDHSGRAFAFLMEPPVLNDAQDQYSLMDSGSSRAQYYYNKGKRYLKSKRYWDALESYNEAIRLRPGKRIYYYQRGIALAQLERFGDAERDFHKYIQMHRHYDKIRKSKNIYSDKISSQFIVEAGGQVVTIYGKSNPGLAFEFERVLARNPGIKTVRLQGLGGSLFVAQKIRRIIRSHGLSTYVADRCVSACTRMFLAGHIRTVSPTAKVGFHRKVNYWGSLQKNLRIPDISEKWSYYPFLSENGVSDQFIRKAMAYSFKTYWYPEIRILLRERIATGVERDPELLGLNPISDDNRNLADLYVSLGKRLSILGVYQSALFAFEYASQLDSSHLQAHQGRIKTMIKLKKGRILLSDFRRHLDHYPDDIIMHYEFGRYLVSRKRYSEALQVLKAARTKDPEDAKPYYRIGLIYNKQKKYRDAVASLSKAIDLYPYWASAYHSRGWAYSRLGKYVQSLEDYDRALEFNINSSKLYVNRSWVYSRLKQYGQALISVNRAIELNQKNFYAYRQRAYLYNRQRKYSLAIKDLNKAIMLKPNDKWTKKTREFVLRQLGL